MCWTSLVLGLRVPDDQVSIVSHLQLPFCITQPSMLSSLCTCPLDNLSDRDSSLLALCPQQTQTQAESANSAPCVHDVSLIHIFELGHTWTMIRNHAVKSAIFQCIPKQFPVCMFSDWRATFKLRPPVWNLIRREAEVMETRFNCQLQPRGFGGMNKWQCGRC